MENIYYFCTAIKYYSTTQTEKYEIFNLSKWL